MRYLIISVLLVWPMFGSWAYNKKWIIGTTHASTQSNYPAMFCANGAVSPCSLISIPQLATVANGGVVTSSNGYDIVWSSGDCNSAYSLLPFDRQDWSATGGWVSHTLTQPSSVTAYAAYLCAGNSSVTTDQSSPSGVWLGPQYGLVFHLDKNFALSYANSSTYTDISSNPFVMSPTGTITSVTGQFGNAALPNSGAYAVATQDGNSPPFPADDPIGAQTLSMWFKAPAVQTTYSALGGYGDNFRGDAINLYYCSALAVPAICPATGFTVGDAGANAFYTWMPDSNWHLLHVVVPSSGDTLGQTVWYLDGSVLTQNTGSSESFSPQSGNPFVFKDSSNNIGDSSTLQEYRIITIAESASWIAMEYANQSTPQTFWAVSNAVTTATVSVQ